MCAPQVLFIADIFVRARMSFDVAGVAVIDQKVIWQTYRRSWLSVDVIAAMPWWLSGVRELKLLQVCTHLHPCPPAPLPAPPHLRTSAPLHRTPVPHQCIAPSHRASAPPQLLRLAKLATIHVKPMKGGVGNLLRILRMMFIYTLAAHWVSVSKCKCK